MWTDFIKPLWFRYRYKNCVTHQVLQDLIVLGKRCSPHDVGFPYENIQYNIKEAVKFLFFLHSTLIFNSKALILLMVFDSGS